MRKPADLVDALRRTREAARERYTKHASLRELGLLYDLTIRANDGDAAALEEVQRLVGKLRRRAELGGPMVAADRRLVERERKRRQRSIFVPRRAEPIATTSDERLSVPPPLRSGDEPEVRPRTALEAWKERESRPADVPAHWWRSKRNGSQQCSWKDRVF
jgi:hypothetical protein